MLKAPAFTPVRNTFLLFSFFCAATVLRTAFLVLLRFMIILLKINIIRHNFKYPTVKKEELPYCNIKRNGKTLHWEGCTPFGIIAQN